MGVCQSIGRKAGIDLGTCAALIDLAKDTRRPGGMVTMPAPVAGD